MKTAVSMLLALVLLAVPAYAAGSAKLTDAVQKSLVKVAAFKPATHKYANLSITNVSEEELTIDPFGSSLRPGGQDYQRLGLAFSQSGAIVIAPGQTWTGKISSVCRDESLRSPAGTTDYALSATSVTAWEREVLAFWKANRGIPQQFINDVIWGGLDFDELKALVVPAAPVQGPQVDRGVEAANDAEEAVREDEAVRRQDDE